jgi:3-oxoacyl-[acyl-carrier protein] reductase
LKLGLDDRVALVSGASQGIGRAIAEALVAEGARVGMIARRAGPLATAAAEIDPDARSTLTVTADMSSAAGVQRAVAEVTSHFGRAPEIAVANNHGAEAWLAADEISDEEMLDACNDFILNLVRLLRAVAPAMKERGFGRILNVGSDCVKLPHSHVPMPLANTTRPAAVAFLKTASRDLGRHRITVNTLDIGAIATERRRRFYADTAAEHGLDVDVLLAEQVSRIPVGRFGRPEEVGALAAALCSDHAGFITAESIAIDGGRITTPF